MQGFVHVQCPCRQFYHMPLRENLDAVIAVINDHHFAVIGDRDTVRVTETVLVAVHTFDECPVR